MTLQGIGTFRLEQAVPEPVDAEKPVVIPENAISFEYQPRAIEDAELVKYISEETGKIIPLASADLDSYLMLARQFLNIGKPLYLPHIGTIEKTKESKLIFKGGEQTLEHATIPHQVPEMEELDTEEDNMFGEFPKERKKGNGKSVLYIILLAIIILTGWAVWRYGFMNMEPETVTESGGIHPVADSTGEISDSSSPGMTGDDSLKVESLNDSAGFRIIVGEYRGLAAGLARLNDLKSYNRRVIIFTTDSIIYKIAEPFDLPLSDTSHILDSLQAYYTRAYLQQ